MKILIFGASGSGTTTLGKVLERESSFKHLDVDDYYWKDTNPPFQEKISLSERNENLTNDFKKHTNVIVSGSLVSWGKYWQTAFDLAIFVTLDKNIRMQRLRKREAVRYGSKLITDSKVKATSEAFLTWAKRYDEPDFTGRSLKIHVNWSKLLSCKIHHINNELSVETSIQNLLEFIKSVS